MPGGEHLWRDLDLKEYPSQSLLALLWWGSAVGSGCAAVQERGCFLQLHFVGTARCLHYFAHGSRPW